MTKFLDIKYVRSNYKLNEDENLSAREHVRRRNVSTSVREDSHCWGAFAFRRSSKTRLSVP
jgi:hypothetical protein